MILGRVVDANILDALKVLAKQLDKYYCLITVLDSSVDAALYVGKHLLETEIVKPFDAGTGVIDVSVHAAASSSLGLLIQTCAGSARSLGRPLMNRCGLAA